MKEPVLRVGLAGVGSVSRTILPEIESIPNVKLAAVADVRQEPLDRCREKYGAEGFTSVEAMCESPDIDAVWICTPNMFHAEHAVLAAEHGKHVICEKPMAVTLDQAKGMVEAVERNSVRYVQGHSKIFDPPVRKMREVVSSGDLGRVIQINTWEYKPWLSGQPRLPSEVDSSVGGGVLYRQGPHQIDIVRGIGGGMVKSLRAIAGRWNPSFPEAEGNYTAFLEFEDGTAATMVFNGYGYFDITEMTWGIGEGGQQTGHPNQRRPRQTAAVDTTTKYEFAAERAETERRQRENSERHQPFFGLTLVSCERGDIRQSMDGLYVYTDDGREELSIDTRGHGRGELGELRDALKEDRPTFPNQRWGLASLEVALTILESSRQRRELPLALQVPVPF
ncbi:MAG TPA: Gfo/Idh/MocA family oxidoreductase [Chloroflexota bacterium]